MMTFTSLSPSPQPGNAREITPGTTPYDLDYLQLHRKVIAKQVQMKIWALVGGMCEDDAERAQLKRWTDQFEWASMMSWLANNLEQNRFHDEAVLDGLFDLRRKFHEEMNDAGLTILMAKLSE